VVYLLNASTFLVDRNVHGWSATAAVWTALAFLVVFWVVYDLLCHAFGRHRHGDRILGVLIPAVVVAATWLACHWFAGRAAFLLVGAMMATAMTANVAHWIIPGQRKVLAQMKAGQPVDPRYGQRAKQRSVHNTYFALPVLFAMLSNHYGFLYSAPHSWLVLVIAMGAGALIRHSFVARHKARVEGRRAPWEFAIVGTLALAGLAVWLAPNGRPAQSVQGPVHFTQVQSIVAQRCVPCHNAQFSNKDVRLDTPELIAQHAQQIYQQAVIAKTMPMNNATQLTDAERDLLKRWVESGARKN